MTDPEALAAVYAATRDPEVRAQVILAHQPLAHTVARGMRRHREPVEDLTQIACIGLCEAIDRYQPTAGSFHTFARATIVGTIRKHYRTIWRIHVPRSVQENHLRLRRVTDQLAVELRRTPTLGEAAAAAGLSAVHAAYAAYAHHAMGPCSLTFLAENDSGDTWTVDTIGTDDLLPDVDVRRLIDRLNPIQRQCVTLYFYEELTQPEIAVRLNVSQATASRSLHAAIDRLRAMARGREAA